MAITLAYGGFIIFFLFAAAPILAQTLIGGKESDTALTVENIESAKRINRVSGDSLMSFFLVGGKLKVVSDKTGHAESYSLPAVFLDTAFSDVAKFSITMDTSNYWRQRVIARILYGEPDSSGHWPLYYVLVLK